MAENDPEQLSMVMYQILLSLCQYYPVLIKFDEDQVWQCMTHYAKYRRTWPNMAWNGPAWPVIAKNDQL